MPQVETPRPGLLFGSFLYHEDFHSLLDLKEEWVKVLGPAFVFVPDFNPLAQYYSAEMGEAEKLKRFFVISTRPYPRDKLLETKMLALEWEKNWSHSQKRSVNLDVGFLTLENFTLATTKNYSHRIYIGQNIFSDLTYHFHLGKFQTLPWTYPDYADEKKMEFFTWARIFLLTILNRGNSERT